MKTSDPSDSIGYLTEQERLAEFKSMLKLMSGWIATPLYLAFWIADLLYAPEYKWVFLGLRLAVLPLTFSVFFLSKQFKTVKKLESLGLLFVFGLAFNINLMIYLKGGATSLYYAGINLVASGSLGFLPFSRLFAFFALILIYGPYYILTLALKPQIADLTILLINSFFIVGVIIINLVLRNSNGKIRNREIEARFSLHQEIKNREKIIVSKTHEAVQLRSLSNQFSPQIVHAIADGKMELVSKIHRSQICAIFIDIVNSTERVVRIDNKNINVVISQFMEDTIKILLKYDVTVDKFLGDGVLAFSNDPAEQPDYIERVVRAAIEIRQRIKENKEFYQDFWQNELLIRVGVASGAANVGFYGNDRYFRSYTAIGPVMNLASRLCSQADPNQILVSSEVAEKMGESGFQAKYVGKKVLKGFESEIINVFEIIEQDKSNTTVSSETPECPRCNTILYVETNAQGIYIFKCRACDYVEGDAVMPSNRKKKVA